MKSCKNCEAACETLQKFCTKCGHGEFFGPGEDSGDAISEDSDESGEVEPEEIEPEEGTAQSQELGGEGSAGNEDAPFCCDQAVPPWNDEPLTLEEEAAKEVNYLLAHEKLPRAAGRFRTLGIAAVVMVASIVLSVSVLALFGLFGHDEPALVADGDRPAISDGEREQGVSAEDDEPPVADDGDEPDISDDESWQEVPGDNGEADRAADEQGPVLVVKLVAVPTNLVGATSSSAQARLESLGFVVAVFGQHSDEPAGNVIYQEPPSGFLERGDRVSLYVSLGPLVVEEPWPGEDGPEPPDFAVQRLTISYFANGGTGTMLPMQIQIGQEHMVAASQFTRQGFTFTGWNTRPDGSGESFLPGERIVNLAFDLVLHAQWSAPHFAVTYHANGGIGTMAGIQVMQGQSHAVLHPAFTMPGSVFVGWNTLANGTGRLYMPGQVMQNVQGNISLFAQWQTAHVPVSHIEGVPASGRANTLIVLAGAVFPHNASIRSPINWSVLHGQGVNFVGNTVSASQPGIIVVRATIPNGRAMGSDFVQDFTIEILP